MAAGRVFNLCVSLHTEKYSARYLNATGYIKMTAPTNSKKYAINTSWILVEKLSRIVSGLLVGVLVARYLGPGQFGLISYALNLVAILTIFSTLGMDNLVVRELITRPADQHRIMGTAFFMRLTGALFVTCIATLYAALQDTAQQAWIVLLISLSIVFQSFAVIDLYFQSTVQGRITAISQVITLTITSIIKVVFILMQAPVEYFAATAIIEAAVMVVSQCTFYQQQSGRLSAWSFSRSEASSLLSHCWPLIASGIMLLLYQKMDQLLIKRFLDTVQLGNYAAAARITEASFFIPVALCTAALPAIVNTRDDRALQHKRLVQLYSLMLWSALIIAIGGTLLGEPVLTFLYREKYNLSPAVFRIHVWIVIPVFYSTAWGMWMITENRQRYIVIYQALCLLAGFCANMLLIPLLGIEGAAYALVASQFLGLILLLCIYRPGISWRSFLSALNPFHLAEIARYLRPVKKN